MNDLKNRPIRIKDAETTDGKPVLVIALHIMKRVLSGKDKEGMRRLINIVNIQEVSHSDFEYFKQPLNITTGEQTHILDSKNNSIGEPLCYEPILEDDFEKWLNKPLNQDTNDDWSRFEKLQGK